MRSQNWWFGDPKKTLQKTHPNRPNPSFCQGYPWFLGLKKLFDPKIKRKKLLPTLTCGNPSWAKSCNSVVVEPLVYFQTMSQVIFPNRCDTETNDFNPPPSKQYDSNKKHATNTNKHQHWIETPTPKQQKTFMQGGAPTSYNKWRNNMAL